MTFLETIEHGTQSEIQKAVGSRLATNAAFFQQNHPEIYTLLTRPPKEYQLLIDEQGINVYQIESKQLVYGKDENGHKMVAASRAQAHTPLSNPDWKLYSNNMGISPFDEGRFPQTGKIINTLITGTMKKEEIGSSTMHLPSRFLPTTTLLGLAGGLFLEYMAENYDFIHSLIIFEENYDFFRISCCFVDYPRLFSIVRPKSCFLFVESLIDRKLIQTFFSRHRISTNFVRLELMQYESPRMKEAREVIQAEQNANARGWGTFEDEMVGVINHEKNIDTSVKKLKTPILSKPEKQRIPICVIGAGPSLDELLPYLQENQDRMILMSAGTALRPLIKAGIKPDFQVEIERMDYLPGVLEEAGLGDVPLIGGNIVNPGVLALAEESYLFLRGSSTSSYAGMPKCIVEYAFPYVGNAAFSLALHFSDVVLMAGMDCGYKKGKSRHADNSMYKIEDSKYFEGKEAMLPKDAVPTRGNFSDDIYTDSLYTLSREMYEFAILEHRPKAVLNLSDGAFIGGTTPLRARQLKLDTAARQKAIRGIKKAFLHKPKEVFREIQSTDLSSEIERFRQGLFTILDRKVTTKREFFDLIDEASAYSRKFKSEQPFGGILMDGTTLHILNTMFILMMHVQKTDIAKTYESMLQNVLGGYGLFRSRYEASKMLLKMGNIGH